MLFLIPELLLNFFYKQLSIQPIKSIQYPGYAPHSGTPDDTVNFNLLLDEVRKNLDELEKETGRYYGLVSDDILREESYRTSSLIVAHF